MLLHLAIILSAGTIVPGNFTSRVDNPWLPLTPGTTYIYRGRDGGKPARDVVAVLRRTETVAGVRCVAVRDDVYVAGRLAERTTDWYAQDRQGNVWYFGEQTAELDARGRVRSTEGTWRAGVHGAQPGIVMPARPRVGASFRQEYFKGHAEDHFRIVSLSAGDVMVTTEWTPLEPGVIDHKVYVRGLGAVADRGPSDRIVLTEVRRP